MAAAGVCPCSSKCLLSHMENSNCNVSTLVQGIFASKAIGNIGDQPCIICPPWQNNFHRCTADWRTLVVTRAGIYQSQKTRQHQQHTLPVNIQVALNALLNNSLPKVKCLNWKSNELHNVSHPPVATRSSLYFPPLLEVNMENSPFQPEGMF